jgi:hypothetical protein
MQGKDLEGPWCDEARMRVDQTAAVSLLSTGSAEKAEE